jgi:hypothetical protein
MYEYIAITMLDIIRPPVLYLKHDVLKSETEFCLRFHVRRLSVSEHE